VADGELAQEFPHRFSTKYLDDLLSLYYYGYRYYSPSLGRWLSKDNIGELGGNFYCFRYNSPLNLLVDIIRRELLQDNFIINSIIKYNSIEKQPGNRAWQTKIIPVSCGGFLGLFTKKGGNIYISLYSTTADPFFHGVTLMATFNESNICCCKRKKDVILNYRWTNLILEDTYDPSKKGKYDQSESAEKEGGNYYRSKEENFVQNRWQINQEGFVSFQFSDSPGFKIAAFKTKKTDTLRMRFRTCLVCATENNKSLACFTWGYTANLVNQTDDQTESVIITPDEL